jgi:hypothetical protein
MMYHAHHHWPQTLSVDLWPYALDYAVYIHNHIPKQQHGWSPIEIFCSLIHDCTHLQHLKVWGCPTYVLNPKLQDGVKILKWDPQAQQGQYMGFSSEHSSLVGLVCNLETEHISPQYHLVFDERFSTMHSMAEDTPDQSIWIDLFSQGREYFGPEQEEEIKVITFPPDIDFTSSSKATMTPNDKASIPSSPCPQYNQPSDKSPIPYETSITTHTPLPKGGCTIDSSSILSSSSCPSLTSQHSILSPHDNPPIDSEHLQEDNNSPSLSNEE